MFRQALLQAADHIDYNPASFRFSSLTIPKNDEPGTMACALGWTGHYANLAPGLSINKVALALGVTDWLFYDRMDKYEWLPWNWFSETWRFNPKKCAKFLRRYANQYFPQDEVLAEAA